MQRSAVVWAVPTQVGLLSVDTLWVNDAFEPTVSAAVLAHQPGAPRLTTVVVMHMLLFDTSCGLAVVAEYCDSRWTAVSMPASAAWKACWASVSLLLRLVSTVAAWKVAALKISTVSRMANETTSAEPSSARERRRRGLTAGSPV